MGSLFVFAQVKLALIDPKAIDIPCVKLYGVIGGCGANIKKAEKSDRVITLYITVATRWLESR